MVSCFISRLVILVFGTLYPAYASYKAVRTKNVREYVKWMMYWIVFALFTCAETFTDLFLSFWFPFYYEIKIITVIYLLSPATKGSSILYRKFVHPVLIKKEQEIDEYIAKAKQQGYHTMLNLGSKGVTYATSLIMHTAIKGGGGLVSQLRKSYSLSDLSEETNLRGNSRELADGVNSPYDEDPEMNQRKIVNIPYQNSSSAGFFPGPIFPEVNDFQRPDLGYFRQVPSDEEISSGYSRGYSAGDSLYYDAQRPKTDNLVRTASLGPSYRVRTRAASKNALPKRASLSEGGSTWSALEPHGSQNETDERFNFFLSRSASLPFPFHSLPHINAPEYQQMLGNFTQNQIFTFINDSQYSQFINNKRPDFENIPEEVLKKEKNVESNNSVTISEESCDNSKDQTVQQESLLKSDVSAISILNDEKGDDTKISALNQPEKNNEETKSTEEKKEESNVENEIQNENSCTSESLHNKAKSLQQRSGKYNKKPALTPPGEESSSKLTVNLTVEEEDTDFFTPNSSPNPTRKHSSISSDLSAEKNSISDSEVKHQDSNALEVIKKPKTKVKKTDFSIPKKLHMPKMSFSFWHQKGDKQAVVSEGSPAASAEHPQAPAKQSENLEYYISLKEDTDKSDKTKEESKCD